MGLSLKPKREFLRCISPNSLKRFRNGFIGRNRRRPASLSTAAGQRRLKIRLFWQKSSLPGLLSSPAWGLLWVISVLDDSRQRQQGAHRDVERFIVRAHEKLTEFFGTAGGDTRVRGESDRVKAGQKRAYGKFRVLLMWILQLGVDACEFRH